MDKTLSSRLVHQGRVIALEVHQIELRNGTQRQREVVRHPGATAVVAMDDEGKVLLVRQFRYPIGRELLEIPAGTLEPNEEPTVCAARELQEETGYKPLELVPMGGVFMAPGYTDEYIHFFYAPRLAHAPLEADDDEYITLERVPLQEALAMIEDGRIVDNKTISALLRTARRLGIS